MTNESGRAHLEELRLAAVKALEVLSTEPDPAFDALVAEASEACDTPISLISLVSADMQRFKARLGIELRSTPRDEAFCAYTIQSNNTMLVPDAEADPRFLDNPLVKGDAHIRSYAAAPLITAGGHRVGAFCVMDVCPRAWTARHERTLVRLATVATRLLESGIAARAADAFSKALDQAVLSERRFEAVFASMAEGVVIQERDSTIVEANPGAEHVLGLTREQLLGRTSFDPAWRLIRQDGSDMPAEEQPSMRCLATGRAVSMQLVGLQLPTTEVRWLRVNSQPFFKDGETTAYRTATTFKDVTVELASAAELARNSVELKNALAAAQAASEAKSAFLANMSHEIRTPLNAVIGMATVLQSTELTQRQREMLDLILSSGSSLEGGLRDLLDISRIEAGQMQLVHTPFDIRAELSKLADIFSAQAEAKGVGFSIAFGAGGSAVVLGDAQRVRQIIWNLAANAVKFTDKGSVDLRVDFLDADHGDQASGLYVDVQDTGIGIERDALPRIFDRFSQADETITRKFGGTGLGLAISRTLAQSMGGSVSAISLPGQGSTFTFHAPLPRAALPDPLVDSAHAAEVTKGSPLRVLVAEDNPANQKMMTLMLEAVGIEIVLVNDGAEAVSRYQANDIDCILMDIHMPNKDGISAISEIRQFEKSTGRRRTPAAMLTADTSEQRLSEARRAGADAELLKPITAQRLVECLNMLQAKQLDSGGASVTSHPKVNPPLPAKSNS